jgi:predicted AAA+ superfamily ATPase
MQEFGRKYYAKTAYIKFDNNPRAAAVFESSMAPKDLIPYLQAESGVVITPGDTLVVFDEIQEVPRAVTALKYFAEEAPDIHIVAAGSSLGITLHQGTSFPVGKVSFLNLYPLCFSEYLGAIGERELEKLITGGVETFRTTRFFHEKLLGLLRQYMYVGGMPEAVAQYSVNADFAAVRNIQTEILRSYRNDFSKYAPKELIGRLEMVWDSVPAQLANENKKFVYNAVKSGARGREFELAIKWLEDCSLIHKISGITKPAIPLKAYENFGVFKLYISDVGLLGALSGINERTILEGDRLFTEFKGALAEQFVCQEILSTSDETALYYWSSDTSKNEVDFVFQSEDKGVVPVEVKAGINTKAKSLKSYCEKFSPAVAYRLSANDYREGDVIIDVPLYAASRLRSSQICRNLPT